MKLVWDKISERLYETGTKNGVVYPVAADGSYPKGVAWNGLTAVSESPSGAEATKLWADDIKYLSMRSAEEFGGTIEAYTYPDEFAECDGSAFVAKGVAIGQQPRKAFGFSFRTVVGNDTELDDHGYKIHLIYGATASPSEKGYQSINDSPEAITFSWEFETTPVEVPGHKPTALITVDSTKVPADKLAQLEEILYGTDNTDARLPLPTEVLQLFGEDTQPSDDQPADTTYVLTQDTEVNADKTYYERTGSYGNYEYVAVENPTGDPSAQGWYEAQ